MGTTIARRFAFGALVVLLAGCATFDGGVKLNGTFSGNVYDYSVGWLGSHAMDVSTSGNSFSGAYCFVALTGDYACNSVSGGSIAGNNISFRVGTISFSGTASNGGRSLEGTYSLSGGGGTWDMDYSSSNSLLTPSAVVDGAEASVEVAALLSAIGSR